MTGICDSPLSRQSVAQQVARHSPAPVLVLREGGSLPTSSFPDPTRPLRALMGLVALDGSELAETALVPAADLVAALAAPARGVLQLTQVVPFSTSEHEEANRSRTDLYKKEEALYEAESYLSAVADHLHRGEASDLHLGVVCSVAAGKDVADTLIRMAEQGEAVRSTGLLGRCDLMVLAPHGRNSLQRWTIGSVTEHVLGATKLPLLIVRPQKQQTTPERELTVKEQEQKEGRFTGGEFVRHGPRPGISSSHTATWSSCHARSK